MRITGYEKLTENILTYMPVPFIPEVNNHFVILKSSFLDAAYKSKFMAYGQNFIFY